MTVFALDNGIGNETSGLLSVDVSSKSKFEDSVKNSRSFECRRIVPCVSIVLKK